VEQDRTTDQAEESSRAVGSILTAGVSTDHPPRVGPSASGPLRGGLATNVGIEVAEGIVLAGIAPRVAAFLVDLFVLSAASITITLASASLVADPTTADVVATSLAAFIAVLYFALSWIGPWSATPGQRLAGMRVVDAATVRPIDAGRALARSVALGVGLQLLSFALPISRVLGAVLIVWPFVLVVSATYDARRQGLHDRWTRTLVVRPATASSFPLAFGCFFIVLLMLAAPFIVVTAAGPAFQQLVDQRSASPPP
jgi:uncharacterized RDD family membrane protein YckC